jgi:hypothetical protein
MTALPVHPGAMDCRWLEAKLKAPSGSLRGFSYAPVGTGQMCDSFRLTLDWKEHAGPAAIIAKCPSTDESSRHIAKLVRNYELEISWYRDLAAASPINCPECFHAEIDINGIDFVLLLEDRSPARQGDQLLGADDPQMRSAIAEMASLHAAHWNSDMLHKYEWLTYSTGNKELVRQLLPGLYPGFCERYRGRLSPEILDMGQGLVDNIGVYLDTSIAARTVIHGDFRLDNLLFSPSGEVTVVDWQTVGTGSPMADLAYFIGTSIADPAAREGCERGLFEYYLAQLALAGISANIEDNWRDYRLYAFSGFIMAVFASMNVERTGRGDEMFAVMAERPGCQAIWLNSLGLLLKSK